MQISWKVSWIRKIVSYENFLEFYEVYKNVCLKFLQRLLKKLENAVFRKF